MHEISIAVTSMIVCEQISSLASQASIGLKVMLLITG